MWYSWPILLPYSTYLIVFDTFAIFKNLKVLPLTLIKLQKLFASFPRGADLRQEAGQQDEHCFGSLVRVAEGTDHLAGCVASDAGAWVEHHGAEPPAVFEG